ncbi:MAG: hypothetical protein JWM11_4965 [Planctomycetaceae bacterium]|nr:hypothetical protein [Planctomycetaceae bacterium]
MSDSRIWQANIAIGLMVCLTSGCSFSRPSMADRTRNLDRISVDDMLEDTSAVKTASTDEASAQSTAQGKSNGRQKLATWRDQRDGEGQSIPLDRTDTAETTGTGDATSQTATAAASSKSSSSQASSGQSGSPFDQALAGGRKTKPRTSKSDSSSKPSGATGLGLAEKNPFEDE